jgi:predicted metal-dependent hydrolase
LSQAVFESIAFAGDRRSLQNEIIPRLQQNSVQLTERAFMPQSTMIDIDGVGPVLFERSTRAKHVNISVKPFKGVRVAVPKRVSFERAEQFALSKKDWIRKTLVKIQQLEQQKSLLSTQLESLDWPKAEAQLIKRTAELAKQHGLTYNRVTVRNQKTKWGSCSAKDNISLNIQLTLLPQELMDYVILHELAHTKVKNHSPAFWQELDKYVENSRVVDAKLKHYMLAPSR